jgi:hypothetical protein
MERSDLGGGFHVKKRNELEVMPQAREPITGMYQHQGILYVTAGRSLYELDTKDSHRLWRYMPFVSPVDAEK